MNYPHHSTAGEIPLVSFFYLFFVVVENPSYSMRQKRRLHTELRGVASRAEYHRALKSQPAPSTGIAKAQHRRSSLFRDVEGRLW